MKKAMIITVGTGQSGEDIAGAICYSIDRERPDYVLFIKTEVSAKSTMPYIMASPVIARRETGEVIIRDPNDVQGIATECEERIKALIDSGISPENIVVDFTSGTKAMSAGLTLAAINLGVGTLSYISGERDNGGRVIPGTEKVVSIRPNRITAELLLREAIRLFNAYQFDSCIQTLEKAKKLYKSPDFVHDCQQLQSLSQAYGLWDRFDLNGAFSVLKDINEKDVPAQWEIARIIKANKQVLYKEINEQFCQERAVDLLENARRRGDIEKKYDDAVARLYRLCEYIAQMHINEEGLYKVRKGKADTSDVDIEHLPLEIRKKFSKYFNKREGKVMLPLYQSFSLLAELGNSVGKQFVSNEDLSKKLLYIRNNSILAHGFNPISAETYEKMMSYLEKLVRQTVKDLEKTIQNVRFPTILL